MLCPRSPSFELEGTPVHPIWSVDRQDFIPMSELQTGEHLQTANGPVAIATIQTRNTPVPVYNIEVRGQHVYEITNCSILVHNANGCPGNIGSVAPNRVAGLLPEFPNSLVDDVITSAGRAKGRTLEGARGISKKLGHAQRGGFKSAFDGIAPTQANAERIIRETLSNPSRTFYGDKVIDVYNAAGQGVRFDRVTQKFIGFLEGALSTQ